MPSPLEIAAPATPSRTSRAGNAASSVSDRDGGQSEAFSNVLANALKHPAASSKTETGKAAARQAQAGESASKPAARKSEQASKAEKEAEASSTSTVQEHTANPMAEIQASEQSQTEPIIQNKADEAAALASENEALSDTTTSDETPDSKDALPGSKQPSALKKPQPRGLEMAHAKQDLQSNFGREVSTHSIAPKEVAQNAPGHQKPEASKTAEKEIKTPAEEQAPLSAGQLEARMAAASSSVISMLLPGQFAQSLPVQSAPYKASAEAKIAMPTQGAPGEPIQATPIPLQGLSKVDKAAMAVAGFELPKQTGMETPSAKGMPDIPKQTGSFSNNDLPQADFDAAATLPANINANSAMPLAQASQNSANPRPEAMAQTIGNAAQAVPPEMAPGPKDFSRLAEIQEHLQAMNGDIQPSGKDKPSAKTNAAASNPQTANNTPVQTIASFGPASQKPDGQPLEAQAFSTQGNNDDLVSDAAPPADNTAPADFSEHLSHAAIDGNTSTGTATAGDAPKFVSGAKEPMAQVLDGTSYAAKNGHKELTIRLNPDNLGEVRVNFVSRGANELTARLIASTPESHKLLESQVDSLRSSLEAQGVRVAHVAVVLAGSGSDMNSAGNGASQNFNQHNGQQQSSGQSASGFNQQQADQQSQASAFAQQMAQSGGQHHAKSPYAQAPGSAPHRAPSEADGISAPGGIEPTSRPTVNEEGSISILV